MIRPFQESDLSWALDLNSELESELSPLTGERLLVLARRAFLARVIGPDRALLIAFDQDADYDSPNFLWFRDRYPRFVYVDRIAVAASARGAGLARTLYQELFGAARDAGHTEIVCEVNIDPPNPASDAFHARLGFVEVGRADQAPGVERVPRHHVALRGRRRVLDGADADDCGRHEQGAHRRSA